MTTQTTLPTIQEFREIQKSLIRAGWAPVRNYKEISDQEFSITTGDQSNGRYGTLYTKNDNEFWLNRDTLNNLPIDK